MARLEAFWDRLADRYAAQPVADQAAYETKLAETRRHMRPDMDVFEFGCGTGSTAIAHAPFVRHIHAIDFSPRMVEIARAKAQAAGVANVTFSVGDISSFSPPAGRYDMIMGHSILHLLEDKQAVLAKVRSMLKPGGVFVSSTVCLGDTMAFMKPLAPVGRWLGLLPVLDIMSSPQLVAAMERAGLAIEHRWQPGRGKAVFIIARAAP